MAEARTAPHVPAGRRRVEAPAVLQMESAECGAACLASVLAHFGRHVTLEEARRVCGVSRDGSSALQLKAAAEHWGLDCDGYSVEVAELAEARLPAILFWGFDHFVVLEGWGSRGWRIMDPALGHRWVEPAEFDEKFTGVVLQVQPGQGFLPGGRPPGVADALRARLRGSRRVVLAAAACGVMAAVPGFVLPALGAVYVDRVLLEGAQRWLPGMIAIVAACMAIAGALAWLQVWILAKLEQRMAISGAATLMEHVLRLPVDFFTHRYAGDIAQRVSSVEGIADMLASKLAPAAVGLVTTSVFAGAMFAIDWRMACVAVALVGLVLILVLRAGRGLVDGTRTLEREVGLAAGTLSSGLSAIEGIKASGRESELFARIASANARVATSVQSLAVRTAVLEAVPELLVALLVSAAVLAFGGWQVMHGHMTIGALLAFQTLLIAALGPVLQVASLGQEIQELRATMARIDDVMRNPVDPLALPAAAAPAAAAPASADAIEFRDVTFGYSESADPLLRGFSLRVGPGRRVAIVGASGSGKSTVARLACGLYAPWSGEVTVDGRPLASISRAERATLIAAVGQSPILFEGSLRENLSLWDPSIQDEWIRDAVADAGLAGLADARGGLGMPVAEGGSNLSGGEAQRVEIARALARRPSILVLDEATSALDATTESQIDRALRRRGCACIVVAHRLSTVRDADEIIVLDAGEVVERGSHEELLALEGAYAAFVRGGGQG